VRGHPGEKGPWVPDGDRFVRRRDHIESRGHAAIRAPLAFARIVRRQDEQVARPLALHPFQAVPQARRPGVALASQIGTPNRLYEQEVARQRERPVGDERHAAQGVSGHVSSDEGGAPERDGVALGEGLVGETTFGAVVG